MTFRSNALSLLVVAAIGVLLTAVLVQAWAVSSDTLILDDGYMFTRYAHNLLAHGTISWNPGAAPTYGLTSPLFLVMVVPLRLISDNLAWVAGASSFASGMLFLLLLAALLWREVRAPLPEKAAAVLFVLGIIALTGVDLRMHFVSGMDTLFALAYLTLVLLIAYTHERTRSTHSAAVLGITGGLAFYARPDLMLYALAVPAALLVLAPDALARRRAALALGVTLGVLGLVLLVNQLYFSTALPLTFYAKTAGIAGYGAEIYTIFADPARQEAAAYALAYRALFLLIGAGGLVLLVRPAMTVTPACFGWIGQGYQRIQHSFSAVDLALLGATLLFIVYYLFFVLQVMYGTQRFYYPTLPALAILAARWGAALLEGLHAPSRRVRWSAAALVAGSLSLTAAPLAQWLNFQYERTSAVERLHQFSVTEVYRSSWRAWYWASLDQVAALPDDLVIATTDVGHPGVMNLGKTIIDMAGLNDTAIALNGFSVPGLMNQQPPIDLFYMPHPYYVEMNAALRSDPQFQARYELFVYDQGRAFFDVAVRRDSPYYEALRVLFAP